MPTTMTEIEQTTIDTIRTLSMDAVQAANSGHPGTPMALAPVAYTLWNDVLNYDPCDPLWPGRDRFVLSCGHASMLLYALIHLAGVRKSDPSGQPTDELAVSLDEVKNFRQWNSLTPGHPEYGHTAGVETTTGPLGQGCGNSVGMAIAQRWLTSRYNRPDFELFDYNIYAICSDGDLMEGLSCEAASLAGHLKLSNLCWIFDNNRITIEGATDLAFSEDVATRFAGFGWHVQRVEDANDLDALRRSFRSFAEEESAPTLIIVSSQIGFGAPNKQGTAAAHGAPLGEDEVQLAKEAYGWPRDEKFRVPDGVREHFEQGIGQRGRQARQAWQTLFDAYSEKHSDLAADLELMWQCDLPEDWDADLPVFEADAKGMATRKSGGAVLNAIAKRVPWLLGGSADLAPSTNTMLTFEDTGHFQSDNYAGRNLHFGVREHAMAAVVNGMALSHLRSYGGTFFVFSDYMRPSMRLASLMQLPSLFVFTHDSIGVGEDGPTHQPVEQLAACRAIPGLAVLRPGDANEVSEAWRAAMQFRDRPSALVLTRQNVPTLDRDKYAPATGVARGGYVLADVAGGMPDVVLLAAGSELSLAVAAHDQLTAEGVRSRVVSMPCFELFDEQDAAYRDEVLPPGLTARVAVEAGIRQCWDKYLGLAGRFVGLERFGASAPATVVFRELGVTVEQVVAVAREALDDRS